MSEWLKITNTALATSDVEGTTITAIPYAPPNLLAAGGGETYMNVEPPGGGFVGLSFAASSIPSSFGARMFAWTPSGDYLYALAFNTSGTWVPEAPGQVPHFSFDFTWGGVFSSGSSFSIRTVHELNVATPAGVLWQMHLHAEAIFTPTSVGVGHSIHAGGSAAGFVRS